MTPPPVSGNSREHCPYYNESKVACSIKISGDGKSGRPSNILADCRKYGREERICVYQKRLSLLPEEKLNELIEGLHRNVYPVVQEVNEK